MILLHLIRIAIFTVTILGLGPRIATGQIVDLTGTWTGSLTCKALNGGVKERTTTKAVLDVTQIGNAVGARLDFGDSVFEHYTGLANPDGKKPLTKGEVALIHCGTDDDPGAKPSFDEVGRFVAVTKAAPTVKASFKGASIAARPESIATCAWKWTRTAVADLGVPTSCLP